MNPKMQARIKGVISVLANMKVAADVLTKDYEGMDVTVLVNGTKYLNPAMINFVSKSGKECTVVFEDEHQKAKYKKFFLHGGEWKLAPNESGLGDGRRYSKELTLVIPDLPEVDLPPEDR